LFFCNSCITHVHNTVCVFNFSPFSVVLQLSDLAECTCFLFDVHVFQQLLISLYPFFHDQVSAHAKICK
jgi:hypothetical protein